MISIKQKFINVWRYNIDTIILFFLRHFFANKPLKDIIMIESHNDFDCNGGAFYDYLIRNGFNNKYKIVWVLKHPELRPKKMPNNVTCVPLFRPSIRKDFYNVVAKYLTADNYSLKKQNKKQRSYFFAHGCGGLKNIKGKMIVPNDIDFVLLQSESYAPIQAEQYSLPYPSPRLVYLGYPNHDVINSSDRKELNKITSKTFNKCIIWMPTFRKGAGRVDSDYKFPLGIPLIRSKSQYRDLNEYLKSNNTLLIIKLHPMQDLSVMSIEDETNIIVLTGDMVKKKNIDNYRLLPCSDALISDYSGVAYDYLQLDRPIAYSLDDMDEYKSGFVVDDINQLIAGHKLFTYEDLNSFVKDIVEGNDVYKDKRRKVRNYIYKYNDCDNCKRIALHMGLDL